MFPGKPASVSKKEGGATMRSALLVCDRAALLKHLRQHFAISWHGAHGASHWARVRNNGLMIAEVIRFNDPQNNRYPIKTGIECFNV